MKKEIFKNIILTFLITVSFVLFFNIWFSEKLWSYDYNFFAIGEKLFQADVESESALAVEDIIAPSQIILTGSGKRSIMRKSIGEYNDCYSHVSKIIASLSEQQKYVRVPESEWTANLKSKSVLLDFGISLNSELLQRLNLKLAGVSAQDVMITAGDGIIYKPCIYVKDSNTAEIYKITAENSNEDVDALITKYNSSDSAENVPFAFELGFDGSRDSNIKITLEPNIAIGLGNIYAPYIECSVPERLANISSENGAAESLMKVFDINRSSMRRYIEKDDVMVYVDKSATLKISPAGVIEYIAEGEGAAIVSGDEGKNESAHILSGVYSLVRNISKVCGADEFQMQITSDLNTTENYEIFIDYYVNGKPVIVMENGNISHAIKIKTENGRLKEFKQYVYNIRTGSEALELPSMMTAINELYASGGEEEIRVADIFTAYINNEGETLYKWCAKVHGVDNVIVIENTEGGN